MQICANKVVLVDFTLTDEAGEVLDSSVNDEPLAYLHGVGEIVPGLDRLWRARPLARVFRFVLNQLWLLENVMNH